MKRLWDEIRGNIKLSNYTSKSDELEAAFEVALKKRTEHTLESCKKARAERLATVVPKDTSDRRLQLLAPLTDHLPLQHYERTMFTCPRLVNVVTVRLDSSFRKNASLRCLSSASGSLQRPSQFRGRWPLYRSTSTTLPRTAATPTTHPRSLPPCSSRSPTRGAAS